MRGHGLSALVLGAGLVSLAGCRREPSVKPAPGAASAGLRASAAPPAPSAPKPLPVVHGCRVLGLRGKPAPAGTPGVGTLLHDRIWLELADGVELQLKHTETTRELSLLGPGRFLACADGSESVLVARGGVTTTPGPGSRAGAEVELGTPFGVVHYADAALRLDVRAAGLTLEVQQGTAALSADDDAERRDTGEPQAVRGPKGKLTLSSKVDAKKLVARCAEARSTISTKTAAPAPSAGPERGAWAIGLLNARKAARLACSRARAATGRLEGNEQGRLDDQLDGLLRAPNAETDAGK
jgi:hypothetical protein